MSMQIVTVIDESGLRFEFDATWQHAVKWDDSTAYRDGIGKLLPGTKAVDILCRGQKQCCLIEVKNFRGHRIENKGRLANGELMEEVAQKARDTLAGVLGAARMRGEHEHWEPYAKAMASQEHLRVVLWLEEDLTPPPGPGTRDERWKTQLSVRQNELKQRLRWLTTHVLVTSAREAERLPGVRVSYLPKKNEG
jgi:hypothetical protein